MPPLLASWPAFLLLLVIFAGARHLGQFVLRRGFHLAPDACSGLPLSIGLGLGLLSYLVLALAAARLLYAATLWLLFALLAAAALRDLLRLRPLLRREIRCAPSAWSGFCLLLVGLALYMILAAAVVPPVYYDIVLYHYAAPDLFLRHHRLLYLPELLHSNYPFTLEMLFTLGLGLQGWQLANLLNAGVGLTAGAAVFALARRAFGRAAAIVALTVFLSSASVMELSVLATGDIAITLFNTLALLVLLHWRETRAPRHLALAGTFIGLAMGVKYTALVLCGGTAVLFLVFLALVDRDRPALLARRLALFLAAAAAVFSPWLLRNLLATGNPVYPFLLGLFPAPDITPAQYAAIFVEARHLPLTPANLPAFLLSPLRLLGEYQMTGLASALGFAFSLFVPLTLFLPRKPPALKLLLVYAALYLAAWTFSTWMVRFFVPALGALAAVVGFVLARCDEARAPLRLAARALLVVTLAYGFTIFASLNPVTRDQLLAGSGALRQEEFLARYYPLMATARFANQHLPPDARLLFFGETRGFYFERDRICPTAFDDNPLEILVREARDPVAIAAGLRALGVTHIVYTPSEAARLDRNMDILRWSPAEEAVFARFLREQAREIHRGPVAVILELRGKGPA